MDSSSQVLLGSQFEEFGWFQSMSTSSTPIRVDTKKVGHIHVLLPTLEYSMPMSSPAAPGLTSPRALCSRVLQALGTFEDVHRMPRVLSGIHCPCFGVRRVLRVVFRVLS